MISGRRVRIAVETSGFWPAVISRCETLVVAGVQRTRNRFSDIAADERFAKHSDDPCGLRAFA